MIKPWTVKQSFYIHLLVESGQNINNTRQQQHAWITCAQSPARDLQKNAPPTSAHFTSCYIVSWCRVSASAGIWSPQHACCLLYPLGAGQHHLTAWTSVKVTGHLLVWAEAERVGDKCTPADLLAASNARPPHCRYSHVWCIIHVPWVYTAFHLFIRTVENILAWEPFYWPFIIGIYNIFIFSEFLKLKVKYTIVVPSAPALSVLYQLYY